MSNLIIRTVLLVTAALFFSGSANSAQTIDLVLAEQNGFKFGTTEPANLDEYVVFIDHSNEATKVWSYHKETKQFTDLNLDGANEIITFKQGALVTVPVDEIHNRAMLTDGTPNGTELIASSIDPGYLKTANNLYLFKKTNQTYGGDVYRTDGMGFSHHFIGGFLRDRSVCESADGNYFSMVTEGSNFQGSNGVLSLSGDFLTNQYGNSSIALGGSHLQAINDQCFVFSESLVLRQVVTGTNTAASYYESEFVQKLSNFTEFNGKLFAIEYIPYTTSYKIHQLDYETLSSVHSVEIIIPDYNSDGFLIEAEFVFYFLPPVLSKNDKYLITGNPQPLFFDELLQSVEISGSTARKVEFLNNENTEIYELNDLTVITRNQDSQYNNFPEFTTIVDNSITSQFKSNKNFLIEKLFVNPSRKAITMLAVNHQTQTKGFYAVTDQLKINHLINGSWYNPEYKSQGLSISKGTRHNKSEYVYLTGYFFREGKPLWLAGVADLDNDSAVLNIELFEFNGLQFLETNQAANQVSFGSIDLQLTGCHSLKANINSPTGNDEITFYRANNINYDGFCQE